MSRVLCVCVLLLVVCCALAAAVDERHFLVRRDALKSSARSAARAGGEDYLQSRRWTGLQPQAEPNFDEQLDPTGVTPTEVEMRSQFAEQARARNQYKAFFNRLNIPSLRIATFNIFMGQNGFEENKLVKDIFDLDADIIGLQEVRLLIRNPGESRDLVNEVKTFHEMYPGLESEYKYIFTCYSETVNDFWFGNVILSRYSFTADCIKLPDVTEPVREKRSAIFAVVKTGYGSINDPKLSGEQHKVLVVNTHLDVYDVTGAVGLGQMADLMNRISLRNIDKVVLMGDFNTHRNKDFASHGGSDSPRVKVIRENIANYFCLSVLKQPCGNGEGIVDDIIKRVKTVETAIEKDVFDGGAQMKERVQRLDLQDSFTACNLRSPLVTTWSFKRVDYIYLSEPLRKFYRPYRSFTSYVDSSDHLPVVVDLIVDSTYLPVSVCEFPGALKDQHELFDDLFRSCHASKQAESMTNDPIKFILEHKRTDDPDECNAFSQAAPVCHALCQCILRSDAADVARAVFSIAEPRAVPTVPGEPFLLIKNQAPGAYLLGSSPTTKKLAMDMSAAYSIPVSLLIDIDSYHDMPPEKDNGKNEESKTGPVSDPKLLEYIRHSFAHSLLRVQRFLPGPIPESGGKSGKSSDFADKEGAQKSFSEWNKHIEKLMKIESIKVKSMRPTEIQQAFKTVSATPNVDILRKHFALRAYLCWIEKTVLTVSKSPDTKAALSKAKNGDLFKIKNVCDPGIVISEVERLAAIAPLAELVSSDHTIGDSRLNQLEPYLRPFLMLNAGSPENLKSAVDLYTGPKYAEMNTLLRASAFPVRNHYDYPDNAAVWSGAVMSLAFALQGRHARDAPPEKSILDQSVRTRGRYLVHNVKNIYGDLHVDAGFLSTAWMGYGFYPALDKNLYLVLPPRPEEVARSRGLWAYENQLEDGNEIIYQPSTVFEVLFMMPRVERKREFNSRVAFPPTSQFVIREVIREVVRDKVPSLLETILDCISPPRPETEHGAGAGLASKEESPS
eukprot:GILJ01003119.1.p1 GENE.GILJ01003119.1~~GILJ01003119.1.p1  ORF type:complete len:1028 (+),score=139.88 GILJ01003119.1:53-3085(+)